MELLSSDLFTFESSKSILAIFGILYLIKIAGVLLCDLRVFFKTYVLPRLGNSQTNFATKYGKWAIITGCTQGIGRSYVDELAKRGMNVVLISRNKNKLEQVAEDVKLTYKGVESIIIVADFTSSSALSSIIGTLQEYKLDIGVLVNNVGLLGPHFMPFLELAEKDAKDIITVNVMSGTILCHALLPDMVKKGKGAIINIASMCSYYPLPYLATYAATKNYLAAFTEAIAAEYADSGVDIQLVDPGQVSTNMTGLFKELPAWIAPTPSAFVKSAIMTLGYSKRTCGYWSHSFRNWLFVQWLIPEWALPYVTLTEGKTQYEYAINTKKHN